MTLASLHERPFGNFVYWEKPEPGREYIVGIDTAEGKVRDKPAFAKAQLLYRDMKPDFSAAIVIEREYGRHVASWHGDIDLIFWPYICAAIGFYYNEALLVPEINGPGCEVVNTLAYRVNYLHLYRNHQPHVIEGDDLTSKFGWFTGPWNRDRLFTRGAEMIAHDPHCTRDPDLIDEIRTIQYDENGVPRARHPHKDDRVLAWCIALQARWEWLTGHVDKPEEEDPLAHLPAADRDIWRRRLDHCARMRENPDGSSYRRKRFAFGRRRRTVRSL